MSGALAIILEQFQESVEGSDGIIDASEMELVKAALATSSDRSNFETDTHDSHSGYGALDLEKWSDEVSFLFNVN